MKYAGFTAALGLLVLAAPAEAQRIAAGGWVDRIEPDRGVITLRYAREILVTPDAELTIDGQPGTLGDILYNARATVLAWKDRAGRLHADVVRVEQQGLRSRRAAVAPGSVLTGEVAGIAPNAGVVILRTPIGFRNVSLGTAPILLGGRAVSIYDLSLGDTIQIREEIPAGGLTSLPTVAVVLTPQQVAGMRQTFRGTTPAPQGTGQPDHGAPARDGRR